tara:strand:+ start:3403 stop:3711 length:309 start_codon:yes stop_codon:yes gene_type:complete
MAKLHKKAEFDKGAKLVARKLFTANGRNYSTGDIFPWRKLAITERKVRLMYEANLIEVMGAPTEALEEIQEIQESEVAEIVELLEDDKKEDKPEGKKTKKKK